MDDVFRFADEFGPTRIIHIHRHSVGLKAIVVVDNTACGAAIGGVRMAPDVSVEEESWQSQLISQAGDTLAVLLSGDEVFRF